MIHPGIDATIDGTSESAFSRVSQDSGYAVDVPCICAYCIDGNALNVENGHTSLGQWDHQRHTALIVLTAICTMECGGSSVLFVMHS